MAIQICILITGVIQRILYCYNGCWSIVFRHSWSADSRLLSSGSKDSTLKVWDIRTRKMKEDLPGHASQVCL
ncbi:hypothetical protein P8452_07502 [Trifolium repens]|nr:hypothetical protein P8452_07502 [Trifolium repens]